MRDHVVERGGLKQPHHTLMKSKCGENTLLTTAPFKYYLEHGLKIAKVYKTSKYAPAGCYKSLHSP